MWGWKSNFYTMHLLFHHAMIRYAKNCNICPLCLYIFILVFIYWTKSPHNRRVRPAWSAGQRCSLFFILYYLCLCVHHNIFCPLLPSLYEPSWDFVRLHIQHDESPKGRGANIVAETSPPPVKFVVWQLARVCWIKPPAYESGGRVVLSVWLTKCQIIDGFKSLRCLWKCLDKNVSIYHVKSFKNQKINSNMTPYSF